MMKRIFFLLLAALLTVAAVSHINPAWSNEAAPEAEGENQAAPESRLIAADSLLVPVIKSRRVIEYMAIQISLEHTPSTTAEEIKHDMPRVNDAFVREAYLFAKENSDVENMDMEALRSRLMTALTSVFGPDKISGLFFTGIQSIKA